MELLPAIIPLSLEDLAKKLRIVEGLTPHVQIDITDGKFVPDKCWPYIDKSTWAEFQRIVFAEEQGLPLAEKFLFEADLMVESPEETIDDWVNAGFSRIIVHFESTSEIEEILDTLEGRVEVGIAVEIGTPQEEWEDVAKKVDAVQFMGIAEIGSQGEAFDERVIPKIERFKKFAPGVTISVDGGVSLGNAPKLLKAGVSRLISGSAVFESDDIAKTIKQFESLG